MIDTYLLAIYEQATLRGYNFKREKIGWRLSDHKIAVTDGQLRYEFSHLKKKIRTRDRRKYAEIANVRDPEPHPIFCMVSGEIEKWEKLSPAES
jgi:hypothetical protein